MDVTETIMSVGKERAEHASRDGVNLATFDELVDAESLRGILEGEGIDARVQDERRLQRFWFVAKPQAGIHVRVPVSTLELARQRLETNVHAATLLQKAVHCPSCNSSSVNFPAMTRKNALPALVAQVAVALGLMRHQCYCENCHYTWVRTFPTVESGDPKRR
jgi:hypothetical protein